MATALEYGLVASAIAIVIITSTLVLGNDFNEAAKPEPAIRTCANVKAKMDKLQEDAHKAGLKTAFTLDGCSPQ